MNQYVTVGLEVGYTVVTCVVLCSMVGVTYVLKELTASLFMEQTLPRIKNNFLENLVVILFGGKKIPRVR